MRTLVKRLKDPVVKTNNLRAIKIHFALSLTGLAFFALLWIILPSDPTNASQALSLIDFLPWIIAIPVMMIAYVWCGYSRLEPAEGSSHLAIFWLACMTFAYGVLLLLTFALIVIADSIFGYDHSFYVAAILYIPLGPLFNSLSFGVISLVDFALIDTSPILAQSLVHFILSPVAVLLPSGLLYLGLRLSVRYPDFAKTVEMNQIQVKASNELDHEWTNSSCENFNWESESTFTSRGGE